MRRKQKQLKSPEELFKTGEIFHLSEKELDRVFREFLSGHLESDRPTDQKDIMRALMVMYLRQSRSTQKLDSRNRIYMMIIIVLVIIAIAMQIIPF